MMAEVLGIGVVSLSRWITRQTETTGEPSRRGRPEGMSAEVKWKIRVCYVEHYRQWGPSVLAAWATREGLGRYHPATIASVIEDLKEETEEKARPRRYEITAPGVMWSEDGTGFKERGRKKELLVLQDECSRFKANWRLARGPAKASDVLHYLWEAFKRYGPPLVLKHDGDSIFHEKEVKDLLKRYEVVSLTSPPRYPPFNGKKERSIRDIKSYERAKRRHSRGTTLKERLAEAIHDLNEERPRPVLHGRTAREVFEGDRRELPKRRVFRKEVKEVEESLLGDACSRRERAAARRKAVEVVLLRYGLFKEMADVSTKLNAEITTE
jgi:transposase InsO family protein